MSETNDYDPGPWKGVDFKSARATYDANAGRSYDKAVRENKENDDLFPAFVSTESECPLIIISDVTGSMGVWPANIFAKLPYLDIEGKEYLGQTMEICFAAVGDAYTDKYPFQVRPFTKGLGLKEELVQLITTEHGGGGQSTETYELAALYFARNLRTPKAIRRPIVIFIGDEQPYDRISSDMAKVYSKVLVNQSLTDVEVFEELKQNCSVYIIRKPYDRSSDEPVIKRHWAKLLGEDHIAELPNEDRVLDVIFGILAAELNRVDYFHKEIEERQRPDQVRTAYRSLATIHNALAIKHSGNSRMIRPGDGTLSKSLLDE